MRNIEPVDDPTGADRYLAQVRGFVRVKIETVLEPRLLQQVYEFCEETARFGTKRS